MALELVGLPNFVSEGAAKVVAKSSASSSFAADYLANPEPSEVWRSSSMAPSLTAIKVELNQYFSGATIAGDSVAVVNHNLRRGTGEIRIVGWSSGMAEAAFPICEELVPTSDEGTSTNTTGSYTDVDEGVASTPDANWIGPTSSGSGYSFRMGFGTPANTPRTGGDYQVFAVYARAQGLNGGESYYYAPRIRAYLYEGGVEVADLGEKHVLSTSGQWLSWAWDAADLGTADGSAVEIRLSCSPYLLPTRYVEVGAVSWLCESTEFTGAPYGSNVLFDTGWQAAVADLGSGFGAFLPSELEPQATYFHRHSSVVDLRSVSVYFRDDHAPIDASPSEEIPLAPDGYVEAGVLVIGRAWSPAADRDYGPMIGIRDLSDKRFTDGGQTDGVRRPRLRVVRIPLSWLTTAEAHSLFERLFWRKGVLSPIVARLTSDSVEAKHSTIYGTLEDASDLFSQMTALARRGLSFSLVEYL